MKRGERNFVNPDNGENKEYYYPSINELNEESREFLENFEEHVIFEDNDIIAINKPSGIPIYKTRMHVVGVKELVNMARDIKTKTDQISPVHRLDIYTSGLVLFGKTKEARRKLTEQFTEHEAEKSYFALVEGDWNQKIAGIIGPLEKGDRTSKVNLNDSSKKAVTSFNEIAKFKRKGSDQGCSMLDIRIFTGRAHQIRAHLKHLEYPIVGDRLYDPDSLELPRFYLHSYKLEFTHPAKNKKTILVAPLTDDFKNYINKLELIEGNVTNEKMMK